MIIEIQEGFKRTTVGIIPIDWDICKLKSASKVLTGSTPATAESSNYGNEYLFVSPGDLGSGKYILKSAKMLSKKGFSVSRKFPKGSILFTCIGSTIGKMGIAPVELTSNQQINAIVTNDSFCNEFLFYQLQRLSKKIKLIAGEQAVPIINKSQFESIYFGFPSPIEQQKIAEILSTWDKAIETCQKNIEQLKQRNKGLAQQLLSGKSNQIDGEGVHKDFHVVGKYVREVSKRNADLQEKRILSVTNSRGFINQSEQFGRELASADLTNYKIVKKGQFAYNPSRVNVGSIDLLTNYESGILSPMYVVFETSTGNLIPEFLYYHLKTYWFTGHIPMFVQGSVRDSLSFDGFSGMKFYIPEPKIQKEIVNILETASAELKLYENKLQNLQLQKKGLMQQLLTGKVRVKIDTTQN